MKTYELAYIVSPDMTSEEAEAKGKEIESAITSREGTIVRQSNPIAKTLSYQIEKRASGYLGSIDFQIEPEKLLEVKEIVSKDKAIVRHMLIIKEAVEFKKKRRTRDILKTPVEPSFVIKHKRTDSILPDADEVSSVKSPDNKGKVELKDIEHELDELLGE